VRPHNAFSDLLCASLHKRLYAEALAASRQMLDDPVYDSRRVDRRFTALVHKIDLGK